jgi:hypothetical protein
MRARLQEIQNQYFCEYKAECALNPESMIRESQYWEQGDAIILSLPLDEQATYADYVIRKLCAEQSSDIIIAMCDDMFRDIPNEKLNSCAMGNVAMLVKTGSNLENVSKDWKENLMYEFHQLKYQQSQLETRSMEQQGCMVQ